MIVQTYPAYQEPAYLQKSNLYLHGSCWNRRVRVGLIHLESADKLLIGLRAHAKRFEDDHPATLACCPVALSGTRAEIVVP
jgi:hypothetical protein